MVYVAGEGRLVGLFSGKVNKHVLKLVVRCFVWPSH